MRRHHTTFGGAGVLLILVIVFALIGSSGGGEGQPAAKAVKVPTTLYQDMHGEHWKATHGGTTTYSVPPRQDEAPVCAGGSYFNVTRVELADMVAREKWNKDLDRQLWIVPGEKKVVFDGYAVWNPTGFTAIVTGYCSH